MARLSALDVIATITDAGSFVSWDEPIDRSGYQSSYQEELAAAEAKAGTDESIITGRATINGHPIAIIVNEFRFLAGSIGQDAAKRIVAAINRATKEGVPLIASTSSGGTRMQEGTPAFVGMVDISRAVMAHRKAGLGYLVFLRNPTTGGVFASWGSLAHVALAEPEALIGFLGPKVFELLNGEAFPSGVQTGENLAHHGVIDHVVNHDELRDKVASFIGLLADREQDSHLQLRETPEISSDADVWDSITLTRNAERAGVRDVLNLGEHFELHGTQEGETDAAMVLAMARIDGITCVVLGQDRNTTKPMGPAGLRVARRGMKLAEELGLPFVTIIDTAGAELSAEAEQGSMAGEIARSIATMSTLSVPSASVLLGQGTGGGALALFPAKVTLAAQHSWMSPLPPEGASAIVFGHIDAAADLARQQKVGAIDLHAAGIVHHLIAEHPDDSISDLATAVAAAIGQHVRGQYSLKR